MSEFEGELTTNRLVDVARGNVSKFPEMLRCRAESSPQLRCGKELEKNLLLQVVNSLTSKDCLRICYRTNPSGFRHAYPQLGQNVDRLWSGQLPILLTVAKKAKTPKKPAKQPCATPEGATENGLVENELVTEITPRLSEAAQREFRIALTACRNTLVSIYGNGVNILTNSVIEELAATVPTTEDELLTIDKITPIFVKKFGEPLLRFIRTHLHDSQIVLTTPFCSRGLLRRRQQEVVRQQVRQQGMNREGMNQSMMNREGMNHQVMNREGMNHQMMNREGMNHQMNQQGNHPMMIQPMSPSTVQPTMQLHTTQQAMQQSDKDKLIEDFDGLDEIILDAFEGMERECMETREVSHPSRYFPSQGNVEMAQGNGGMKREEPSQIVDMTQRSGWSHPSQQVGTTPSTYTPIKSSTFASTYTPTISSTPQTQSASPSKRIKSGLRSMLGKKVIRSSQTMEITDLAS